MSKIDTAELLARVDIVDVVGREVSLKKKGAEFVGICPFHNDSNASLQVNQTKQIYKCFACGAGGDAIDFLTRGGMSFQEAADHLDGKTGTFKPSPVRIERPDTEKATSTPIIPVPSTAPEPTNEKRVGKGPDAETLRFIKRWEYRDLDGALIGYTVRFHDRAGKKLVYPQTFVERDGKRYWAWAGFPKPRPIYGLPKLRKRPDATVLIVEGEKAADAATKLFPDLVCIAWQGGTDGVAHVDWSPLHGRKVVIWPDNDEPGMKAAAFIGEALAATGSVVRYVTPPPGAAKGWDIADGYWTSEQALSYVRTKGVQVKAVPAPTYTAQPEPGPAPNPEPGPEPVRPVMAPVDLDREPEDERGPGGGIERGMFKFLGFEKTELSQAFCFFVNRSKTIVRITASGMSKNNLLTLVPDPTWWEANFPAGKSGMSIDNAVAWLVSESYRVGMFNEQLVRGRGAWMDAGRVVLHSGDYLVVDGEKVPLGGMQTRFMYEQANALQFHTENPLTTAEANKLMDILELVNWERPVNAHLLAGWCVLAPVCGALQWRPHIWITGGAGTGKSWILERVVRPLLGDTGLAVQGETTEAGLRQTLKHDAMPIVFDEADTDGKNDNERIQKVLAIMRSASTSDGGKIIKGSAGGRAMDFNIKSCFALGSIAVQAAKAADKTRISVLAIKRILDQDEREDRWARLQEIHHRVLTAEFTARLQARTVRMLPTILENAKVFAAAAGAELGYQRTGDQIGTLIAGAYSLYSSGAVTYEQAVEWIRKRNWDEERGLDEQRDEQMLLQYLLEQMIRVEGQYSTIERSIGELIQVAAGKKYDTVATSDASDRLSRHGFKVQDGYFVVSSTHEWVRRTLEKTAWANGHAKILARLEGAQQTVPLRFASGAVSRGVAIPLAYVIE
jgi:putative DNA primase/helicase